VPYDKAFEMDEAEMWAACVVFGELGTGLPGPRRYDWGTLRWCD